MKKTEQVTVSQITGTIYWADVRPIEGDPVNVMCVGEKRDITDQAIKAVYQHFLYKAHESPEGAYAIRCDDGPWLRIQLPPVQVEIDGVKGEIE